MIALLLTFSGFYSGLGRNAIAHRIRTQKRRHAPSLTLGGTAPLPLPLVLPSGCFFQWLSTRALALRRASVSLRSLELLGGVTTCDCEWNTWYWFKHLLFLCRILRCDGTTYAAILQIAQGRAFCCCLHGRNRQFLQLHLLEVLRSVLSNIV